MINHFKILSLFLLPFWFFVKTQSNQNEVKEIDHTIVISHPGEKSPIETILTEVQNEEGLPVEYYMDVRSVICLEEVCKVIPVRLFWNNVGIFSKYKLDKGATLEKYEADIFDSEDYIKLNSILSNSNSPFKEVNIDEILTVPDELNEDIDAVSGATALELDEKDTVPGAALTCFTLWHWANGAIISKIKNITGTSATNKQLLNFIQLENQIYFNIALQHLKLRGNYSLEIVDAIYNQVLKDDKRLKEGMLYLESTPIDVYLSTLKKLISNGEKEQKLAVIRSLNTTKQVIPKPYLDEVSNEFSNLNSFHEVSILLELMQTKNPNSLKVNQNVFPLLKGNFIAARRAYWFLKNQKLDANQLKTLNNFYESNKTRL